MSIPLDRLYHYIESVAKDVYGDTIIYHFWPHGSKKLINLTRLTPTDDRWESVALKPHIYCYDQEPLNYDYYQTHAKEQLLEMGEYKDLITENTEFPIYNLRAYPVDIYDKCILLHSELNSVDVKKYNNDCFIPVYYWNHAFLALDWFRYANHYCQIKNNSRKKFLVYNRAWAGTREYRLKFADLLIDHNLLEHCRISCNTVDPGTNTDYRDHIFKNIQFKPTHKLEEYYQPTTFLSAASADFDIYDYENTDVEVVLETLYDESRLHLTEKILRPIALGQPFILAGTPGSLKYLQSYGFMTFSDVFDESYDNEINPIKRLKLIVKTMNQVISLNDQSLSKLVDIAQYNKKYFFSDCFFNIINSELKKNLHHGLQSIIDTNTSKRIIDFRKSFVKNNRSKFIMTDRDGRDSIMRCISAARSYYNHYLSTLNK